MSGTIVYNDQYIPEGRTSYYTEHQQQQQQQQQQHLLHPYQHQQQDQEEGRYRGDATSPNTLYQLKSFIRDNLTQGGSFNSNGSSEGSLDHDISWNSPPPSSSVSLDRGQQQTPEPQPLTRSNVTVHDTLWRKDEDPEHFNRDYQEYRLTPPLSSLGRDINDKLNNQHWAELMQASEKAYESDHSSSQDTMIIRTEEEGLNVTDKIPFSSYASQSIHRSHTTQDSAGSSSPYNYQGPQRTTVTQAQSFVDNRDKSNLKPGIKRRPSLGQIRRQNATTTRLELSSGPLSPVRSDGNMAEESQSQNRWGTSGLGNDLQTSSYDYPHTGQGLDLSIPGESNGPASSPAAATAMYVTSSANSGDGDQGYSYVDASRGLNQRDYSQEISRAYQPHPDAATAATATTAAAVGMEKIYNSGNGAERQYNIVENTQAMTPLRLEVPAQHQQPKGGRNTEDDKDDGYDSPDALSSDAGSSSSVNSASPTDRTTANTATASGGTQSMKTLELDRVQQSTPTPHKTKTVTFGGVETRIYDVEPPSPRPRLLLRPAKIKLGSSTAPKLTQETSAADRLKTNFGYVDRGKVASFRGMNAALRRQAFQQSPQNQAEDSLEDKLKQLTLGNSDNTEVPTTPNQQQQHTGRYPDDHSVYGYHANLDKQSQVQATRAGASSMAQHSTNASHPNISTSHSHSQPVNDSIRFSHASRPDDVTWQRSHEATPSRQTTTQHTNVSLNASSSPYEVAIPGPGSAAIHTTAATVEDRNQAYRTRQPQLEPGHLGTQRRELGSEHTTHRGMYPRDSTYARSPQVPDSGSSSSRSVGLSGMVPLLENNKTSPEHLSSPSGNRVPVYTDERFPDSDSDPRGQNTDRYRVDPRQGQSGMIPLSDNMLQSGPKASEYHEQLSPTQRMLKGGIIDEKSNYFQGSSLKPRTGMVKSSSDYESLSSALAQPVVHPPAPKRSMSQSTPSLVSGENIYGYHPHGGQGQGQGRRSLAYDDYGTTSRSPASANSSPDRSPAHQPSIKTPSPVLPPPKQTKLYYTPQVEPEGTDAKITRTIINDLALKQAGQANNARNLTDEDSYYISKNQTQSVMTRLNELRQSQARIKRPSPAKSSPPQSDTKLQTPQSESPYAHLLRHKPSLAENAEATKHKRLSSSNVYQQHHSLERIRPNSDQTAMDWRAGADIASRSPPLDPLTESEMSYPITNPRRAHRAAGIWSQDSPTSPLSPNHPTSPKTVSPPGGHHLQNSPPYQRSSTASSYDRMPVATEDTPKKNMIYTTAADLFKMLDS